MLSPECRIQDVRNVGVKQHAACSIPAANRKGQAVHDMDVKQIGACEMPAADKG